MRPGQNKRSRGRNGNNPHHNNGNRPRLPQRIQTFDSNGPNVKIRGNAYQVFERYVALAREAATSGDRIAAENLYQHAEHYFRVMNASGDAYAQGQPRPMTPADSEMGGDGDPRMGDDGDPRGDDEMPQEHQPQAQMQPQPPHSPAPPPPPPPPPAEDDDRLPSFLTGRPD